MSNKKELKKALENICFEYSEEMIGNSSNPFRRERDWDILEKHIESLPEDEEFEELRSAKVLLDDEMRPERMFAVNCLTLISQLNEINENDIKDCVNKVLYIINYNSYFGDLLTYYEDCELTKEKINKFYFEAKRNVNAENGE